MDNKETIKELEAKLLAMQKEMKALNENLQNLKSDGQEKNPPIKPDFSTLNSALPPQPDIPIQNNFENLYQNPSTQNNYQNSPQNVPPAFQPVFNSFPENNYSNPKNDFNKTVQKNNSTFENVIGKSFMGIVASLLIFIGIILFVKAVAPNPNVTEMIKLATLYVVSFAIIFFGLAKLRKNKNDFYISLTACGLGMLYITIILTYSYFSLINELVLLFLLLIWCTGVLFLSKYNSVLFVIIGRIGITISIIAAFRFNGENFLIITVFALIAMVMYGIFDLISSYDNSAINNGFNVFNFFILYASGVFTDSSGITNSLSWIILSILPILFVISSMSKYKSGNYNASFAVFNSIYAIWFAISMGKLYTIDRHADNGIHDNLITTIIILVMLIYVVIIESINKKLLSSGRQDINYVEYSKFVPILIIAYNILRYPFISEYTGFAIIIIPLMLAGFIINSKVYQNIALILLYLYVLNILDINWIYTAIIGLAMFILTAVLMSVYNQCYRSSYKKLLYIIFLIHTLLSCANILRYYIPAQLNMLATVTAIVIIHCIATFAPAFNRNFKTKVTEPKTVIFLRVINFIIMIFCLLTITQQEATGWIICAAIIAIAAFSLNTVNLCREPDAEINSTDIYICIKYIILDITIIKSLDMPNIIVTISWIILAVGFITIGVITRRHQFRMVGLILTIISIFKLLMLDIFFNNLYMRALGFIISGILCFIISLIYNNIDKRLQNKEGKQEKLQ